MRQGQNKRARGRNRKNSNPLSRNYESNGPDVKVRGTASHVAEKYVSLARDAQSSGDRVMYENYLQHAEHYSRIVASAQANSNAAAEKDAEQPSDEAFASSSNPKNQFLNDAAPANADHDENKGTDVAANQADENAGEKTEESAPRQQRRRRPSYLRQASNPGRGQQQSAAKEEPSQAPGNEVREQLPAFISEVPAK